MSKPDPPHNRTSNWNAYTAALKKRGSLLIRLEKDTGWFGTQNGSPGRAVLFSDAAIQACLTIKVLFGSPLPQTTGMMTSILKPAGVDWPVPN